MLKISKPALFLLFSWSVFGTAASQEILLETQPSGDTLNAEKRVEGAGLPEKSISEGDPDSLFRHANTLYQEGDYESALETYQKVLDAGFESADLYYNMGNAAFRSNSIGYAILYYEKTLKMDPFHEDARHNLEFVSRYRLDTFEQVPRLFIWVWIEKLVSIFPERTWSILSLVFFILVLVSTVFYLFARKLVLKKTGFFSALIGLLLFSISLFSGIARHHSIVRPDKGIVLAPSVVVRSTPSQSGTELFILHEGTRVELNERVAGWRNIRVEDGREGWIPSEDFESI
jgi:tetratricopeptide (TPR) repeat protein